MSVSRLFGIRRRSDTTTPLNRSVVMRSLKLCCRPISGFGANGYRFRALNNTVGHHNAVKFSWEMIDGRGQADSIGTTFLLLDETGRVKLDYQFTDFA
jgi:hypothetical protein